MKRILLAIVCTFLLCSASLSACATSPTETVTTAPETANTENTTPEVGGTLVWVFTTEPDTLDPHKTNSAASDYVMQFLGTSLVAVGPDGSIIPYAAESWTTSEDGLVWEFKLRQDMKFHNGDSITAADYAWTYQRAADPDTASPAAASMLGSMTSVEAVDDYTLRITLSEPYFPFLYSLSDPGYMQPLSQTVMEEMGEEAFAHAPVGSGPYRIKEWLTGERIVLERNPDYTWGPDYGGNTGPYYIENIEFRIIPEYATQVAGLEAGEIDFMAVENKDMVLFEGNDAYTIYEHPIQGIVPYVVMNLQAEPFTDLNVRKAFNLALNRQALIDVLLDGKGVIQYGPISESVIGYWSGVEEIGYGYDPDKAGEYLQAAGYEKNADGMWAKDREDLTVTFIVPSSDENITRMIQLVQAQYIDFGIDAKLETMESGVLLEKVFAGDFQATFASWYYPEADLLYLIFHSAQIGALNIHYLNDPEIDALLEKTRTETDAAARQQAVDDVQKWIVENAVVVPLYTAVENYVLSSKVEGELFSPQFGIYYNNAYIVE